MGIVPLPERSFYEAEFAGSTVVVALADPEAPVVEEVCRAATSLARSGSRLVLVVGAATRSAGVEHLASSLASVLGQGPIVLPGPSGEPDASWLADLWLAATDRPAVLVAAAPRRQLAVAAGLASALRALKLVVTDPMGGWGDPPRSFVDVDQPVPEYAGALGGRQAGQVVAAIEQALAGGVTSVNLCRAAELDRELFTFDGTGTLFTSGGYLRLDGLRIDDLRAVEELVAQGVADGVLRPRSRQEVARLAVTGMGARVIGSDHLAGIVSLEREPYRAEQVGEVACLYAVSRFSGSGAGGLLVDGLVDRAAAEGLRAVFAVTVSDAAAEFFSRKGFTEVGHDEVPAVKWTGYDPVRKAKARALLRNTSI